MVTPVVLDIEVARNYFCLGVKQIDDDERLLFEISEERNDYDKLYSYLTSLDNNQTEVVTFNGIHYDNPILAMLHYKFNLWKNKEYNFITSMCFALSTDITTSEDWFRNDKEYKKYKYYWNWVDIDLLLYWSKMLRQSKNLSLKALGIQLNYPVVMELPYEYDELIPKDLLPKVREYNLIHDLNQTEWLYEKLKYEVESKRQTMKDEKLNCMSWDGVKIGYTLLIKHYAERRSLDYVNLLKQKPKPFKSFKMGDTILPFIDFKSSGSRAFKKIKVKKKSGQTKTVDLYDNFSYMLEVLKNTKVNLNTKIAPRVRFANLDYDCGLGGLHTVHDNQIIKSTDDYRIIDIDVSSYYPSLGAQYKFVSDLFPGMEQDLEELKNSRLEDKANGRKKEADRKKLMLNGGYFGNLNMSFRATYDYKQFLGVTINGQLLLLMLAETLQLAGVQVDSTNTDGVTVFAKYDQIDLVKGIVLWWEELTKLQMEYDYYDAIYRSNINNYIAVRSEDSPDIKKGKCKIKGRTFITNPKLGDSCDYLVIPKAIQENLINGTPVRDFIMNHNNYYNFMASQKVNKKFTVYWGFDKVQRLNRYYISTKGKALRKKSEKSTITLPNASSVMLCNDYNQLDLKTHPIDYSFYIREAQKTINDLKGVDLGVQTLF